MHRRDLLKAALAMPLLPLAARWAPAAARGTAAGAAAAARVRPGDPGWPGAAEWDALRRQVGGRLLRPHSPFADCAGGCRDALRLLGNPFALGDDPALTQTSGWAGAWRSQPSAYAVAAEREEDVTAAVAFARRHRLRLVVKGGGHSYQGTSQAPDSLLVWTRRMNRCTLHDAFVPEGCAGMVAPTPAVTVQAGALWADAYHAVTTRAGRYVQGGGCTTVGVAGLVQSGGFGSFSKRFGTAASNLLEARVVTADGVARTVNARREPELFWALKGGGGGSLGVLTELTLRTFDLPEWFGAVLGRISARSGEAMRALIARAMAFYAEALHNPHWGEQLAFQGDSLRISMVFQGMDQAAAERTWAPFLDWVKARPEYRFAEPVRVLALPARHFWDLDYFRRHAPELMVPDDRPGAPAHHGVWAGDREQVGWFIHAFQSAWLPQSLLSPARRGALADALFDAARQWHVSLHFNKGLAGGDPAAVARARDTATHPQATEAFALAICAAAGDPAFPGMPGPGPDLARARQRAAAVDRAMDALRRVAPQAGSYVSESDYFLRDWPQRFWGANHARLAAAKRRYDPEGLFFVHHGVGSESWSADGFARRPGAEARA